MARRTIYVFGSNEGGFHGAGTAAAAARFYGAELGIGFGPAGESYAIPTKDKSIITLPLSEIERYVDLFRAYAEAHPELLFHVTKVGCGLAGYTEDDIGPLFHSMPENVGLPAGWLDYDVCQHWFAGLKVLCGAPRSEHVGDNYIHEFQVKRGE